MLVYLNYKTTNIKVPTSVMGKLVGSMCCISGIFVISLPIPIIVGTFAESYKENKTRKRELRKKSIIQSTRKKLERIALNASKKSLKADLPS
jgi:ABC-type phosphate transport system permease subunit